MLAQPRQMERGDRVQERRPNGEHRLQQLSDSLLLVDWDQACLFRVIWLQIHLKVDGVLPDLIFLLLRLELGVLLLQLSPQKGRDQAHVRPRLTQVAPPIHEHVGSATHRQWGPTSLCRAEGLCHILFADSRHPLVVESLPPTAVRRAYECVVVAAHGASLVHQHRVEVVCLGARRQLYPAVHREHHGEGHSVVELDPRPRLVVVVEPLQLQGKNRREARQRVATKRVRLAAACAAHVLVLPDQLVRLHVQV
mmetsp:Transcript_1544/g.5447  ORF Transcript_1544/g.5447 Transcript_1544/m.5447 type:complete len:252 (-) Transcript_1544:506-1261(-)